MFKEYSPMQYLAIDIANQMGFDKQTFESRISWVKTNRDKLESYQDQAEEPMLFKKAVNAFRQAEEGIPTGHVIGLDSASSGLQLMSAMMGCKAGMALTGLIMPNVRADAYSLITKAMNEKVPVEVTRKEAKDAVMKGLYGSTKVPKDIFGDLVPFFYETMHEQAPGAMQLLELLRQGWNPEVDRNTWALPDGYMAMVPITETVDKKVHIAQLRYTPVVRIQVIAPQERGLSLIANVIHSVDAYVLRSLVRRCNYSVRDVKDGIKALTTLNHYPKDSEYLDAWQRTGIVDMTMINGNTAEIAGYPKEMRQQLIRMLNMCLEHKPFEIITVHDDFKCSPVNANQMRRVYADILGDLVDSTLVDDLLNQVYQDDKVMQKLGDVKELAKIVRESNYGLS